MPGSPRIQLSVLERLSTSAGVRPIGALRAFERSGGSAASCWSATACFLALREHFAHEDSVPCRLALRCAEEYRDPASPAVASLRQGNPAALEFHRMAAMDCDDQQPLGGTP